MSQYQTVREPDGKILQGAFPTLDWFDKINLDFQGLNIVDIGCAEGMFSVLAKENGANRVVCVDSDVEKFNTCQNLFLKYGYTPEVYNAKFEDMAFDMDYDVVFCSMILHWFENGDFEFRRIADATKKYIVVIYRSFNSGYVKENGNWFPTEEELERLAKSVGFEVKQKELLMTQDNGKQIWLTVFERYKSYETAPSIIRKNNIHLDKAWCRKVEAIQPYFRNFLLESWDEGYYWSRFIDGRDLFGDKPFHPLHGKQRTVFLNKKERESVQKLLDSIKEAGEKTGFYIQDVTKRNIILKDGEAYLVDFDMIGKEPDVRFTIS